jgi:hypothetical protein
MKKKVIKIILIVLAQILIIAVGFVIYGSIMTLGNSRMPIIEVPQELKELENILQKETKGGDAHFNLIPKYEIEKCEANLDLNMYVNNDSITQSKELLDAYINSVNARVNKILKDKECIDSLIIDVSSHYSEEKTDSLKSKHYRYSFPIKWKQNSIE